MGQNNQTDDDQGRQLTKAEQQFKVVQGSRDKLAELVQNRKLCVPPNYAVGNAVYAAWLELQETEDKNNNPALDVCEPLSVRNALLRMAVQGLTPAKDQCYFIVYGKTLNCMTSKWGWIALAQRQAGLKQGGWYTDCVIDGDEFEYEIVLDKGERGKRVTKHVQNAESRENAGLDNLRWAYAILEFEDGREYHEVRSIDQIKQAWDMARGANASQNRWTKFQREHPLDAAERTVLVRACKRFVNTTDDSDLELEGNIFKQLEEGSAEAEHSAKEEESIVEATLVEPPSGGEASPDDQGNEAHDEEPEEAGGDASDDGEEEIAF